MANRDLSLRNAFYQALEGNLTYNGVEVGVYDSKMEGDNDVYVLLIDQTAEITQNFSQLQWATTITLQIVSLQLDSVSKDIVDTVSEQIENIILDGYPMNNGLIIQSGWQIVNNGLTSVTYTAFDLTTKGMAITKNLVFGQIIIKL